MCSVRAKDAARTDPGVLENAKTQREEAREGSKRVRWGGRVKLQPPPSLPGSPGRGSEKLRPGQDHLMIQQCAGPLAWGRTG